MEVASRLGLAAAQVTGVKTFDDMLKANVVAASLQAGKMGVKAGMKGREALKRLLENEEK
jgi:uncharacterized protein YunC (DUF1805 family)